MHPKTAFKALIIIFAGLVSFPALAQDDRTATIAVSGNGSVEVAPDMAIVSVGVLREAKTAEAALRTNNEAMAAVMTAMENQGIEQKDLQTSNFSIQPRYVYPKAGSNNVQKPPKIVGYVVSNTLDIRIRDLEKAGEILDLVVTLGVNTGGNIRFTNQDTTEFLKEARINAVKDAMSKASTLAETAGVELGDILSITENFNQPRPTPLAQARNFAVAEASADRVPIAGGENSYRVTVNISWEIDQ